MAMPDMIHRTDVRRSYGWGGVVEYTARCRTPECTWRERGRSERDAANLGRDHEEDQANLLADDVHAAAAYLADAHPELARRLRLRLRGVTPGLIERIEGAAR